MKEDRNQQSDKAEGIGEKRILISIFICGQDKTNQELGSGMTLCFWPVSLLSPRSSECEALRRSGSFEILSYSHRARTSVSGTTKTLMHYSTGLFTLSLIPYSVTTCRLLSVRQRHHVPPEDGVDAGASEGILTVADGPLKPDASNKFLQLTIHRRKVKNYSGCKQSSLLAQEGFVKQAVQSKIITESFNCVIWIPEVVWRCFRRLDSGTERRAEEEEESGQAIRRRKEERGVTKLRESGRFYRLDHGVDFTDVPSKHHPASCASPAAPHRCCCCCPRNLSRSVVSIAAFKAEMCNCGSVLQTEVYSAARRRGEKKEVNPSISKRYEQQDPAMTAEPLCSSTLSDRCGDKEPAPRRILCSAHGKQCVLLKANQASLSGRTAPLSLVTQYSTNRPIEVVETQYAAAKAVQKTAGNYTWIHRNRYVGIGETADLLHLLPQGLNATDIQSAIRTVFRAREAAIWPALTLFFPSASDLVGIQLDPDDGALAVSAAPQLSDLE
ncbi:hypothetical protein D9C73_005384 [Collichthys lucidus]|uniref:Uncharacterized protein n=1 Tax=Collichthys lucidus TaxID=240159 RepID=A0A4U5U9T8_COLLU|nr:hypothetical protein D9C73_005384 [Collichthys lucidus]